MIADDTLIYIPENTADHISHFLQKVEKWWKSYKRNSTQVNQNLWYSQIDQC